MSQKPNAMTFVPDPKVLKTLLAVEEEAFHGLLREHPCRRRRPSFVTNLLHTHRRRGVAIVRLLEEVGELEGP